MYAGRCSISSSSRRGVAAGVPLEPLGDRAVAKRGADVPDPLGVLGVELGHLDERRGRLFEDARRRCRERARRRASRRAPLSAWGCIGTSDRMMWRRSDFASAGVDTGEATWIEITYTLPPAWKIAAMCPVWDARLWSYHVTVWPPTCSVAGSRPAKHGCPRTSAGKSRAGSPRRRRGRARPARARRSRAATACRARGPCSTGRGSRRRSGSGANRGSRSSSRPGRPTSATRRPMPWGTTSGCWLGSGRNHLRIHRPRPPRRRPRGVPLRRDDLEASGSGGGGVEPLCSSAGDGR